MPEGVEVTLLPTVTTVQAEGEEVDIFLAVGVEVLRLAVAAMGMMVVLEERHQLL